MQLKKVLIIVLTLVIAWCGLGVEAAFAAYNRPYYIEVDLTNQIVTIFNTSDGSIARQMLCSAGANGSTPTGVWYLPKKKYSDERTKWYYFGGFRTYAQYATRINGPYLFHSIPFDRKEDDRMSARAAADFGVPASHGCIRLRVEDARFIAKECLAGTRVKIYKSGDRNEELRQLLYISSYTGEDGMTYPEFMGISEDDLGYGSTGSMVRDLQMRLSDLGYYDGPTNGSYGIETIAAVKAFQKDLGMAQNGISSPELLEVMFSEDAPVSAGQITLTEGRSGPVVKQLQIELNMLGVYNGAIDSVYDVDVVEAVKLFQRICGYNPDGIATPEIQHLIHYELDKIQQALGADAFTAEFITEEMSLGRVHFEKAKIIIRSKPDTESSSLTRVGFGDSVLVLETRGDWANVIANGQNGFMYVKYLTPYTAENTVLRYSANGNEITIGNTVEEYIAGASTEADEFKAHYASEQFQVEQEEIVDYVTVNTGSNEVRLNMRAQPGSDAEILLEIPNGTSMRVLSQQDDWTRVAYGEEIGYLMSQYLTFWQGGPNDVEDAADTGDGMRSSEEADQVITAVLMPDKRDGKVKVYAEPDTDSEVLAWARSDVEVSVLSADEETGWVLIDYKGRQGYMQDTYLSFRLIA